MVHRNRARMRHGLACGMGSHAAWPRHAAWACKWHGLASGKRSQAAWARMRQGLTSGMGSQGHWVGFVDRVHCCQASGVIHTPAIRARRPRHRACCVVSCTHRHNFAVTRMLCGLAVTCMLCGLALTSMLCDLAIVCMLCGCCRLLGVACPANMATSKFCIATMLHSAFRFWDNVHLQSLASGGQQPTFTTPRVPAKKY